MSGWKRSDLRPCENYKKRKGREENAHTERPCVAVFLSSCFIIRQSDRALADELTTIWLDELRTNSKLNYGFKKQQHVTVKQKTKKTRLSLSAACPIRVFVRVLSLAITHRHVAYIFLYSTSAIFCPSPPDSDKKGNTTNFDPCVHFAGDYKFSGVDVSYIISGTLTLALCCVGFIAVTAM